MYRLQIMMREDQSFRLKFSDIYNSLSVQFSPRLISLKAIDHFTKMLSKLEVRLIRKNVRWRFLGIYLSAVNSWRFMANLLSYSYGEKNFVPLQF